MTEPRESTDPTRKALKVFGITVTDFRERSQALLERSRAAGAEADRARVLEEAAQLTADLHHALHDIQNHVYQLQSDFLMQLIVRGGKPD